MISAVIPPERPIYMPVNSREKWNVHWNRPIHNIEDKGTLGLGRNRINGKAVKAKRRKRNRKGGTSTNAVFMATKLSPQTMTTIRAAKIFFGSIFFT